MRNSYFDLLKQWCGGLLSHQIRDISDPLLHGGLLCPACGLIHGRCHDAIYPLLFMADKTGDPTYLQAAMKLQDWSARVSLPDGSFVNDIKSDWKGITVFAVIGLGEAIRHYGHLLDAETRNRWRNRLRSGADYLLSLDEIFNKMVNYPLSCATALAVAATVLDDKKYLPRAGELARLFYTHLGDDGLLWGEGSPADTRTPKGCRPVDLGYDIAETLPNLTLYARLTGDEAMKSAVVEALKTHLEFMLPDGGWDNSFGSRSVKWTYWGSRTTDGCAGAYAVLAGEDPRFSEAALRNTELLARCTHDGLLHGGPHYRSRGVPPCIHHTFTYAKSLASAMDLGPAPAQQRTELPCDQRCGAKKYETIATWLAGVGPWRATVTEYDLDYFARPSGGSLTLLFHTRLGPIFSASLSEYSLVEPGNQQMIYASWHRALTPRIQRDVEGKSLSSAGDLTAEVSCLDEPGRTLFNSRGTLAGADFKRPTQAGRFEMLWELTPDGISLRASCDQPAQLILPVISPTGEPFTFLENQARFDKPHGQLQVAVERGAFEAGPERIFMLSPGLEAIELRLPLRPEKPVFVMLICP